MSHYSIIRVDFLKKDFFTCFFAEITGLPLFLCFHNNLLVFRNSGMGFTYILCNESIQGNDREVRHCAPILKRFYKKPEDYREL